jgi:UPF0716 family protein affecting phage T7 exclusion
LHGYFLIHSRLWQSIGLVIGGLLLIEPGTGTDLVGAIIAVVVIVTQVIQRRAQRVVAAE